MKLPNGYGSVYKLSGKRRKPWAAYKTMDWIADTKTKTAHQKRKLIGTFATREQALSALGKYNSDPYEIGFTEAPTFGEIYEKWSEDAFERLSDSQIRTYKIAAKCVAPLWNVPMKDLRLTHLQRTLDRSGKNAPSARRIKTLYSKVFAHAVKHEVITPEKASIVKYVEVKTGNPDAKPHKVFSKEEIDQLWKETDGYYSTFFLFLIYTGLRLEEALSLKKEDVHLDERYLDVIASKTAAGVRQVPIAEKVVPIVKALANTDSRFLIKGERAERITKANIYKPYYWKKISHGLDHTPHDARHTCASLLADAGVDERIVRAIIGHAGHGITEKVYTHISLAAKLAAINMI